MRLKWILGSLVLLGTLAGTAWAAPALPLPATADTDLAPVFAAPAEPGLPVCGDLAGPTVPVQPLGGAQNLPAPADSGPKPVDLPGVPSALLMGAVGCLCVGLFRSRRTCAALVVSFVSICAAGLGTLPRLVGVAHAASAPRTPVGQPVGPDAYRMNLVPATADRDFVGLLRRLGTEGGSDASGAGLAADLSSPSFAPAVGSHTNVQLTAGSLSLRVQTSGFGGQADAPPTAEPPTASLLPPFTLFSLSPSSPPTHSLFARPPPLVA